MKMLVSFGKALHCFFDWPMLHTRIYVYAYLVFAGYQGNKIIDANIAAVSNVETARSFSDSRILYMVMEGLLWSSLLVIAFYVSPKVASYIVDFFAQKRGIDTSKKDGDGNAANR